MQSHIARQAASINLTAPATFLNVTDPDRSGYYLFGNDNFRVADLPVAGVLHRTVLGAHEDFVLGVISVFLIALLSEIVQTILMRTHENRISRRGLHVAFVLDEVHHFRNVWRLARRDPSTRDNSFRRRVAVNSLIIVFIGGLLLAAEVVAVYLTQPVRVYLPEHQYNIVGVQPAGTVEEMAVHINDLAKEKRCITPSMMDSNQSREYTLNACIMRSSSPPDSQQIVEATYVEVKSWFHEAGSNHEILFGNDTATGFHDLETRVSILQSHSGVTRAVLFNTVDSDRQENARYLQNYMMDTVMRWNCKMIDPSCAKISGAEGPVFVAKKIKLWTLTNNTSTERMVTGISTRYEVRLKQPFISVENALHVFATSAIVMEVRTKGQYVNLKTGEREESIPRLVSDEGRVAGLSLLLIIFGVLLVFLVLLRVFLRPTSLAQIARSTIDDDEETGGDFVEPSASLDNFNAKKDARMEFSSSSLESSTSPRRFGKFLSKNKKATGQVTDLGDIVSEGEDYQSTITMESS